MRNLTASLLCGLVLGTACTQAPDTKTEVVPVGADTQAARQEGAPVAALPPAASLQSKIVATPAKPTFREVTIPATTNISVRLRSSVSSERSRVEDAVTGELAKAVVINGDELLPAGAELTGVVSHAVPAGKVKGRASLALHFRTVSVDGRHYPINARFERIAPSTKKADAQKVGIPAIGGAVVGAIFGGKKGAAIGAAAGGGAGTVVVLSTAGKPVTLPEGTVLSLDIGEPIDVRIDMQ